MLYFNIFINFSKTCIKRDQSDEQLGHFLFIILEPQSAHIPSPTSFSMAFLRRPTNTLIPK